MKGKKDAVDTSSECFVQGIVIPLRRSVERIRTSRGGEYAAGYFESYCLDTGIRHEFGSVATPQHVRGSENDGRADIGQHDEVPRDGRRIPEAPSGRAFLYHRAARAVNRAPHAARGTLPRSSFCKAGRQVLKISTPSALESRIPWNTHQEALWIQPAQQSVPRPQFRQEEHNREPLSGLHQNSSARKAIARDRRRLHEGWS